MPRWLVGTQRKEYSNHQLMNRTEAGFNTAKAEALEVHRAFNHLWPFLSVFVSSPLLFSSSRWVPTRKLRLGTIGMRDHHTGLHQGRLNGSHTKLDGREPETARHGTGERRECPHFPPDRRRRPGLLPDKRGDGTPR